MLEKRIFFAGEKFYSFYLLLLLKRKGKTPWWKAFLLLLTFCKRSSWSSFDHKAFLQETERKWPQEKNFMVIWVFLWYTDITLSWHLSLSIWFYFIHQIIMLEVVELKKFFFEKWQFVLFSRQNTSYIWSVTKVRHYFNKNWKIMRQLNIFFNFFKPFWTAWTFERSKCF